MHARIARLACLIHAFAACLVSAQEPLAPALSLEGLAHGADWMCVAAGEERSAPGGLRVLRPSYKAELETNGFSMTPFRGADAPRSLPFAWRSTTLARGGASVPLEGAPGVGASGDLAWADHGTWVERYELRANGIEQSWLFTRLPAGEGDLVIAGAVESELRAEPRAGAHAPIAFADEHGEPAMTYGAAFAIDARGRRLELATSWDGEHLEIRVDGAWLTEAALPLLVDPLLAPVQVPAAFSGAPLRSTCLGREAESPNTRWLVGVVRSFSATDSDVAAYLCDDGFANPRLVYLEAAPAHSDHTISACYIASADRWVIAHQRDYSSAAGDFSAVRVYFHDRANTTTGSGLATTLSGEPTHSYSAPDLGGASELSSEVSALLSFQIDATTSRANTAASGVRCARVDAAARQVLAHVDLAVGLPASGFDRERPALIPVRFFNGEPWIAVWTERSAQAGSKARLLATHVSPVGVPRASAELYAFSGSRHVVRPLIAGMLDFYWVAWGGTSDLQQTEAHELLALTVRWNDWNVAPQVLTAPRRIAGPLTSGGQIQLVELVHDTSTFSHAAIAYLERTAGSTPRTRAHIARLGGTGGLTESAALFDVAGQDAAVPSVVFDHPGRVFHAACGAAQAGAPVQVRRFEYSSEALVYSTGNGCGTAYTQTSRPLAGNRDFGLALAGAPPSTPVLFWFSSAPAALPLDALGMPGCTLRVDPSASGFAMVPATTDATGRYVLPVPLPDAPVFLGDVWYQVLYLEQGANALNLQLTAGGRIQVR